MEITDVYEAAAMQAGNVCFKFGFGRITFSSMSVYSALTDWGKPKTKKSSAYFESTFEWWKGSI